MQLLRQTFTLSALEATATRRPASRHALTSSMDPAAGSSHVSDTWLHDHASMADIESNACRMAKGAASESMKCTWQANALAGVGSLFQVDPVEDLLQGVDVIDLQAILAHYSTQEIRLQEEHVLALNWSM